MSKPNDPIWKLTRLEAEIRRLVPRLTKPAEHDGDTGYYLPIKRVDVLDAISEALKPTKISSDYELIYSYRKKLTKMWAYGKPLSEQPEAVDFLFSLFFPND